MKIAIGADHRGFKIKEMLKNQKQINNYSIEWMDVGTYNIERSDYPIFVRPVCLAVQQGKVEKGILICSTGVGMSIAANRFSNIYAALAWNEDIARLACQEDKANVLVLPSDYISDQQAIAIVQAWLAAEFKGGRYQERLDMLDEFGGQ